MRIEYFYIGYVEQLPWGVFTHYANLLKNKRISGMTKGRVPELIRQLELRKVLLRPPMNLFTASYYLVSTG